MREQMCIEVQLGKKFAQQHLQRMVKIKELMQKFVVDREEYIVENTSTLIDHLIDCEETSLQKYLKSRNGNFIYQIDLTQRQSLFD